jgi:hypothetical protein
MAGKTAEQIAEAIFEILTPSSKKIDKEIISPPKPAHLKGPTKGLTSGEHLQNCIFEQKVLNKLEYFFSQKQNRINYNDLGDVELVKGLIQSWFKRGEITYKDCLEEANAIQVNNTRKVRKFIKNRLYRLRSMIAASEAWIQLYGSESPLF